MADLWICQSFYKKRWKKKEENAIMFRKGGKMEQDSKVLIFIKAIFMAIFYSFMGICVATIVASVSMEGYREHPMLWTFLAALFTIPFCVMQLNREGYLEKEKVWEWKNSQVIEWIVLVLFSISSCIALNYWITISGLMKIFQGFDKVAQTIYTGKLLEEFLAVVLAAPLVEELIFRGLAYQGFQRLWKKQTAMVASALFFGIYHRNIVQGLYAFFIGLLLVYVFEWFGTIRAAILFHIAANAASVVMTECLDLRFLEKDFGALFVFTMFFTIVGIGSFGWLHSRKKNLIKN